ncbi:methyl-accepting chemotaxis protein [Cohnella lupini]|uniref:Methyl-accepting chemotaxis protein n=1 Tax=Cohnella lupini TaxID=1294267 RepID=A0A3D9I278_9BACL|nr:HAMP domain-containing methyl-accepting chemotaxis protein [Cohnella lupini]RED55740.1 methyl-accepting chemotaxis protein [Cohnella lupini]
MKYTIQIKLMISFTLAALLLGLNGQMWYSFAQRLHSQRLSDASFESELLQSLGVTVGLFALVIIIGLRASRAISKPAAKIVESLEILSLGNLQEAELRLLQRDELGDAAKALNLLRRNLRSLIRRVADSSSELTIGVDTLNESADQTVRTAKQIGDATQTISLGSERQVDRVAVTVNSFMQINNGLQKIAEFSETVDNSAWSAVKEAEAGNEVIRSNVEQMKSIQTAFGRSADIVRNLGERSEEIARFVSTIQDISDTTNLLALNASIEAARAGEHGRGFSVVADRVKQLAYESKQATRQISQLIASIQNEIRLAFETMQTSRTEVQTGMNMMTEAGQSFQQILHAIHDVRERSLQVRDITEEASSQSTNIALTFTELESIARTAWESSVGVANFSLNQATSMEGLFQATESLQKMASELDDLVHRFRT